MAPRSTANISTNPLCLPSAPSLPPVIPNSNNKRPLPIEDDEDNAGQRPSPHERGFSIPLQLKHDQSPQAQQQQTPLLSQHHQVQLQVYSPHLHQQPGSEFIHYDNFQHGSSELDFFTSSLAHPQQLLLMQQQPPFQEEQAYQQQPHVQQQGYNYNPQLQHLNQQQMPGIAGCFFGSFPPTPNISPETVHSPAPAPVDALIAAPMTTAHPNRAIKKTPPRIKKPSRRSSLKMTSTATVTSSSSAPSTAAHTQTGPDTTQEQPQQPRHANNPPGPRGPSQPPAPRPYYPGQVLRVGGFALEEAGIRLPASLTAEDRAERMRLLAQELGYEETHPPVLPPTRVPDLPPKPLPPTFPKVTDDMPHEERERTEAQIRRISAGVKKTDQVRNNMAAKKSRSTRAESLCNTRLQLNAKSAECLWLRLQLVAQTGTLLALPSAAWGGFGYAYRTPEAVAAAAAARGEIAADAAGENQQQQEGAPAVPVVAAGYPDDDGEACIVPLRVKVSMTEEVAARVQRHEDGVKETQKQERQANHERRMLEKKQKRAREGSADGSAGAEDGSEGWGGDETRPRKRRCHTRDHTEA